MHLTLESPSQGLQLWFHSDTLSSTILLCSYIYTIRNNLNIVPFNTIYQQVTITCMDSNCPSLQCAFIRWNMIVVREERSSTNVHHLATVQQSLVGGITGHFTSTTKDTLQFSPGSCGLCNLPHLSVWPKTTGAKDAHYKHVLNRAAHQEVHNSMNS